MNKSKYHKKRYLIRKKFESICTVSGECPECGGTTLFYHKYDAFCCLDCNIWLNPKCKDPKCPYCSQRPNTPSEAICLDNTTILAAKNWRRDNYYHKKQGELKHRIRAEAAYLKQNKTNI